MKIIILRTWWEIIVTAPFDKQRYTPIHLPDMIFRKQYGMNNSSSAKSRLMKLSISWKPIKQFVLYFWDIFCQNLNNVDMQTEIEAQETR